MSDLDPAAATRPDAADLRAGLVALREARRALRARRRDDVLAALDAIVEAWLAPDSPWMDRALAELPTATGFSLPMLRTALPTMLTPLRAPALAALVAREAGTRHGPPLILHILPGNLPGLAAIPAALSLAIGSAALIKPGRGDRVFPALFHASLAAHDRSLADALAVHYWPGDDHTAGALALDTADLVVAAGDDETIAALAARTRGRFIGHGHRISFALVTAAAARERTSAAALAFDTALWDQRGCLSPQLCFVEGTRAQAEAFATELAAELARLAESLPPASMSLGQRLAIRRLRDSAEWATFDGERISLLAAADEAAGTVIVEPRARFVPSPLGRTLRVMPIADLDALPALLAPVCSVLEGTGLGAEPERWETIAQRLAACGVALVSPLGAMQQPPLAWRQGGRPRLTDWVTDDG